jgi:hypothetical protein
VFEEAGITFFNLVAQWCALTIGDRRVARRWCRAGCFQRLIIHGREAGRSQFFPYQVLVVIPVWSARKELWRVVGKDLGSGCCDDIGEFVGFNSIPHIENERTAWLEDPVRFGITGDSVRVEHDAELTYDRIE